MKKVSDLLLASSELKKELIEKNAGFQNKSISRSSNLGMLLEAGIGRGSVATYPEMALEVYGNETTPQGTLSSLASRLGKKALDEIAFVDLKPVLRNDYERIRYEVQRNIMIADLFHVKGRAMTSIHIWIKSLSLARRHGFTLEACHCAMRLSYQFAFRRRKKEHYNMRRMYKRLLLFALAESEAKSLYERVVMLMQNKMYFPASFARTSKVASVRTYQLALKYKTPELWLTTFKSQIFHAYIRHDFSELVIVCKKYRKYLLQNKYLHQDARLAEIAIHEMNASLSLRNFKYGIQRAEENVKFIGKGSSNWLTYRENYFRLLLHAKEYVKAVKLYEEVMGNANIWKMNSYEKSIWQINYAYLHFALNDSNQVKRFTPVRFFNQLQQIKTEKPGYNFLIQTGIAMYFLAQKQTEHLEEFKDNFRKYIQRHIDRRKHYRTYYFSLLLLTLFKYSNDVEKAEAIGEKFYKKLVNFKGVSPHDREITELIPYDHLWLMLLRLMGEGDALKKEDILGI